MLQSDGARTKLKCAVRSASDAPIQWEKEVVEMPPTTAEDAALPPIVSKILPSGRRAICHVASAPSASSHVAKLRRPLAITW